MTYLRDIAWQQNDLQCKASVAYQFAHYALCLNYEMLPRDVVHEAKRCLLDALGCAIGAYDAPGRPICEEVAKELGGPQEATIIGSGLCTSANNATLVNSFLVRFLDFNDMGGGGHGADAVPAILAVGERQKASGRDILTALVIAYELGARWHKSITMPHFDLKVGVKHDTRAGFNMPPAIGKLMELSAEQIANAIGICASGNVVLEALDTPEQEFHMRKNLRFGWVACSAILSCMLAQKGFTGPVRVLEGAYGVRDVLFRGEMDLERMTDFRGWRILDVRYKYLAAGSAMTGVTEAILDLVTEHDLKPEDIAAVHLKIGPTAAELAQPSVSLLYPRNAESADHSAFYVAAIAIKERCVDADAYQPEKFTDPTVLELMEKTTVEVDPSIPEKDVVRRSKGYDGKAEIITKDGRKFEKHVASPHGFGDETLTDKELEAKFSKMASKYMDEKQIQTIFDAVWNAEKLDDIGKLMRLMVFRTSDS